MSAIPVPTTADQVVSVQACDACGQVTRTTLWELVQGYAVRQAQLVWLCGHCRDKALGLHSDCPAAPYVPSPSISYFGD